MAKDKVLEYFDAQARNGEWGSLYNPKNPISYSFIMRLQKAVSLMKLVNGKYVCDLGCGTGILIPFVLNGEGKYIGVDNSNDMLNHIRNNYADEIESGDVKLILSYFEDLKLDVTCEVFIGLGFIEYFDNPIEIMKKINKMLPEHGQLILSFPNFKSIDYYVLRLLSPIRFIARRLLKKETPQPPRKLWTVNEAKKMLHAAGYTRLRKVNYSVNLFFYPFTRFFPRFCNSISALFEYSPLCKINFFSTGFIISAKKH